MSTLIRNWWAVALRGVVAILFGMVLLGQPALSFAFFLIAFAVFALVDGVFSIIAAFRAAHRKEERWWQLGLRGLLGVGAAAFTYAWPGLTALTLLFVVAFWAISTGILEIFAAIRLRHEIQGEWLLGLSGLLSVVLGVMLVARPGAGIIALTWLIGIYAIIAGALLFALAFRLYSLQQQRPIPT